MTLQDTASKGNPLQMALMDEGTSIQVGSYWISKTKGDHGSGGRMICITAVSGNKVTAEYASTGTTRMMLKSSLICNYVRATEDEKANAAVVGAVHPAVAPPTKQGPHLRALKSAFDAARKQGSKRTTIAGKLTPSLSSELLENNPSNRQVSSFHVDNLARDMTNDRWRASHQGVGLGPNLELGDGQHRVLACIKSGKTVPMDFTCYHDPQDFADARKVWDTNWRRSKANVLELSGLVPKGHGKDTAAVLEAITYIDGRRPVHPTNEDMVQMFKAMRVSVEAVARMNAREFLAPTRAAFVIAHLKCPSQIDECIRLVTTKAGLVDGTAAHALVMKCGDLQRAKRTGARVGLMRDILSLLYKHVKGQPGVAVIKNNEQAYRFFLGDNFRPTKQ